MYVYIYIYTYYNIHLSLSIYIDTYIYTHTYIYIYIHIPIYVLYIHRSPVLQSVSAFGQPGGGGRPPAAKDPLRRGMLSRTII